MKLADLSASHRHKVWGEEPLVLPPKLVVVVF